MKETSFIKKRLNFECKKLIRNIIQEMLNNEHKNERSLMNAISCSLFFCC